jgi:hypothetical protein
VTDDERAIIEDTKDGAGVARRVEIVLVLDILNEDRLRRIAAERMSRSGFDGRLEDLQSLDLSRLAYEALLGSSPDDLSPLDMGVEIVDAGCPKDEADLWDSASTENDGFWFRHLPETTVDELFQEEREMLKIVRENDGFWLSEQGRIGESRYTTLAAAKSAGNRICDEAYESQEAEILNDAGLDPAQWTFKSGSGMRFIRTDGASVEADADGFQEGQAWHAYPMRSHGTDAINDDPVGSVSEAVALLSPIN